MDKALDLWRRVRDGRVSAYQPAHWVAEVAAVLARLSPATVQSDVLDLHEIDLPVLDTPAVHEIACRLAVDLSHHLFNTLYRTVALNLNGAVLATAEDRYYRKARGWPGCPPRRIRRLISMAPRPERLLVLLLRDTVNRCRTAQRHSRSWWATTGSGRSWRSGSGRSHFPHWCILQQCSARPHAWNGARWFSPWR